MKRIFIGPGGLRAGWRLLLFAIVFAVVAAAIIFALHLLFPHKPPASQAAHFAQIAIGEAFLLTCTLVATLVMGKIERRPFGLYGLPWSQALRGRFWSGALVGFVAIGAVLFVIFTLHGFRIVGVDTSGWALASAALFWTVTALLIGVSEELFFRGYPQYTLTTGMGFWPAALVLSLGFGAAHLMNGDESFAGIASVAMFALVFCLVLRRTGNLWFGVGFHASWDWGESFFFGVPDSGLKPWHSFLASRLHGPLWLTGGQVGPEGSVFTFAALALVAVLVWWRWPTNRYPTDAFPGHAETRIPA